MEHAYWNGKLIYATRFLEEEYIPEKEIREASANRQIICTDPLCKKNVLKYCHGNVKAPYFAHIENSECDYAEYDKTRSEDIATGSELVYAVLSKKGFNLRKEVKLLEHHYSHLVIDEEENVTAIEFFKKNLNVRTTEKLSEYEKKGYSVAWVELGNVDTVGSAKDACYGRRFALNEYGRTLLTIDHDFNRVKECKLDFNNYTYCGMSVIDKEMYFMEKSIDDLTFENGVIGLEGFQDEYDEWVNARMNLYVEKCTQIDEVKEKQEIENQKREEREQKEQEEYQKYLENRELELEKQRLIYIENKKVEDERARLEEKQKELEREKKRIEREEQFKNEKEQLREKIMTTNGPVRNLEGKQVYMCRCCGVIGYHNIFEQYRVKENKGICKNCYDAGKR